MPGARDRVCRRVLVVLVSQSNKRISELVSDFWLYQRA